MARVLITGDASSLAMEQWLTAMRDRGHILLLVSPNAPRAGIAEMTVTSEDSRASGPLRLPARIMRIRQFARDFGATVYHAHYATDFAFWPAVAGLSPLLVTCWGSDVLLEHTVLTRFKRRVGLRSADFITATSRFALERAQSIARPATPAEVIHWGVDVAVFHPAEERENSAPITFLSFRNLFPLYNVDVVIRAFAEAKIKGAQLRVAGGGPMRGQLEAMACELGVGDAVHFLGSLPQVQVAEELRQADVCVSVPESDATAVSNLEAMASGVPLIASTLPSTREWVEEDATGLLVLPGDVSALAKAMRRLAEQPLLRESMGRSAREIAVLRADRAKQMDRASEIYDDLERGQ